MHPSRRGLTARRPLVSGRRHRAWNACDTRTRTRRPHGRRARAGRVVSRERTGGFGGLHRVSWRSTRFRLRGVRSRCAPGRRVLHAGGGRGSAAAGPRLFHPALCFGKQADGAGSLLLPPSVSAVSLVHTRPDTSARHTCEGVAQDPGWSVGRVRGGHKDASVAHHVSPLLARRDRKHLTNAKHLLLAQPFSLVLPASGQDCHPPHTLHVRPSPLTHLPSDGGRR